METIEERAKAASEGYDDDGYSSGLYMGYVVGATEQKAIDDAELSKLKSAWGNEIQVNRRFYIKGYQDAVEKICNWLINYFVFEHEVMSEVGCNAFLHKLRKGIEK